MFPEICLKALENLFCRFKIELEKGKKHVRKERYCFYDNEIITKLSFLKIKSSRWKSNFTVTCSTCFTYVF
jgi:hypothetical protein